METGDGSGASTLSRPSIPARLLISRGAPFRATLGVEHEVKTLQILKQPYGYFLVRHGGDEHSFPPGPLTLDKASFVAYLSSYGFSEAELHQAILKLEGDSEVTLTVA